LYIIKIKKIKIYFLLLSIFLCLNETSEQTISVNSKIKSKYIVMNWDSVSNSNYNYCGHEVKNCAFLLLGNQVNLREKFILDKNGNLEEYWFYGSEGPFIYTVEDLRSDLNFLKDIGGENMEIQLNKETIIDSGQEYKIEKVYENYKLILVEETVDYGKTSRKILYEYE